MKTLRPNQTGTFSNRVNVADTEDTKLFTIEYSEYTDNLERAYLTNLITCSADMLKALKKIIATVDRNEKGLLGMYIDSAKAIVSDIEKNGKPYNY